jgi:predicted porin
MVAQTSLAQMPENLSTDPEGADTYIEQAFRPYFFTPIEDTTQWNLQWRTYYLLRNNENADDSEALTTGGWIGWHSKPMFEHLRVGATTFTSQKIYAPADKDGTGLLAPGQESFGGVSEAYLDWSSEKLNMTAGRLMQETPFMHSSDIRMIPITYQGARALYHITERWAVGAMYTTHMKPLDSDTFESMYDLAGIEGDDRGVWTLGTRYRYSGNGELGFIAYHAEDLIDIFYSEIAHEWGYDVGSGFKLSAQYSHQQSDGLELRGNLDIDHIGVRLQYKWESVVFASAYTQTSDTQGLFTPWGYAPTYNGGIVREFTRPGEKALSVGGSINFRSLGEDTLKLHTYYIHGETPDSGETASPSQSEFDITLEYNFDIGRMTGLNLRVRNAIVNQKDSDGNSDASDLTDFRVILNYNYRW